MVNDETKETIKACFRRANRKLKESDASVSNAHVVTASVKAPAASLNQESSISKIPQKKNTNNAPDTMNKAPATRGNTTSGAKQEPAVHVKKEQRTARKPSPVPSMAESDRARTLSNDGLQAPTRPDSPPHAIRRTKSATLNRPDLFSPLLKEPHSSSTVSHNARPQSAPGEADEMIPWPPIVPAPPTVTPMNEVRVCKPAPGLALPQTKNVPKSILEVSAKPNDKTALSPPKTTAKVPRYEIPQLRKNHAAGKSAIRPRSAEWSKDRDWMHPVPSDVMTLAPGLAPMLRDFGQSRHTRQPLVSLNQSSSMNKPIDRTKHDIFSANRAPYVLAVAPLVRSRSKMSSLSARSVSPPVSPPSQSKWNAADVGPTVNATSTSSIGDYTRHERNFGSVSFNGRVLAPDFDIKSNSTPSKILPRESDKPQQFSLFGGYEVSSVDAPKSFVRQHQMF